MNSYLKTIDEFKIWWRDNNNCIISLDFETTSLKYLELEPMGFSICNGINACYVNVNSNDFNEYMDIIVHEDIRFIMHNSTFDLAVLKKYGYIHRNNFCTCIGAQVIDGNRIGYKPYSLKSLARDWLGIKKIRKYEEAAAFGFNSSEFVEYATNDAIWTWMLHEYIQPKLVKTGQLYLFEKVEMPFQLVLVEMQTNGVLLDPEKHDYFTKLVYEKLISIEAKILAIFGLNHQVQLIIGGGTEIKSPVNFNSSKQVVGLIENRLGFTVDLYTDSGEKSVATEYLLSMVGKHEFFDLMIERSAYNQLYKTYLNKYQEKWVDEDGRIRPSFLLAASGRLRCTAPNLQNLPNAKKQKTEFNIRESYVSRPGYKFVRADWAGQELAVLGEVSRDDNIIQAFAEGVDLHLLTANRNFGLGLSREQMKKTHPDYKATKKKYAYERDKGKNGANFPIVYGTTPAGIAARQNVTKEEAQNWMNGFFELYPGVKRAITKTRYELKKTEKVCTLMGRIREFPGYNGKLPQERAVDERAAFNHKIQGLSADICKIAAVRIMKDAEKYGAFIVLQIHDELVYEVPDDNVDKFAERVKYHMENSVTISTPLEVEVSISDNLG